MFQRAETFCIAGKLNTEDNMRTEVLWKSSKYVDKQADSVCARLLLLFLLAVSSGGENARLSIYP